MLIENQKPGNNQTRNMKQAAAVFALHIITYVEFAITSPNSLGINFNDNDKNKIKTFCDRNYHAVNFTFPISSGEQKCKSKCIKLKGYITEENELVCYKNDFEAKRLSARNDPCVCGHKDKSDGFYYGEVCSPPLEFPLIQNQTLCDVECSKHSVIRSRKLDSVKVEVIWCGFKINPYRIIPHLDPHVELVGRWATNTVQTVFTAAKMVQTFTCYCGTKSIKANTYHPKTTEIRSNEDSNDYLTELNGDNNTIETFCDTNYFALKMTHTLSVAIDGCKGRCFQYKGYISDQNELICYKHAHEAKRISEKFDPCVCGYSGSDKLDEMKRCIPSLDFPNITNPTECNKACSKHSVIRSRKLDNVLLEVTWCGSKINPDGIIQHLDSRVELIGSWLGKPTVTHNFTCHCGVKSRKARTYVRPKTTTLQKTSDHATDDFAMSCSHGSFIVKRRYKCESGCSTAKAFITNEGKKLVCFHSKKDAYRIPSLIRTENNSTVEDPNICECGAKIWTKLTGIPSNHQPCDPPIKFANENNALQSSFKWHCKRRCDALFWVFVGHFVENERRVLHCEYKNTFSKREFVKLNFKIRNLNEKKLFECECGVKASSLMSTYGHSNIDNPILSSSQIRLLHHTVNSERYINHDHTFHDGNTNEAETFYNTMNHDRNRNLIENSSRMVINHDPIGNVRERALLMARNINPGSNANVIPSSSHATNYSRNENYSSPLTSVGYINNIAGIPNPIINNIDASLSPNRGNIYEKSSFFDESYNHYPNRDDINSLIPTYYSPIRNEVSPNDFNPTFPVCRHNKIVEQRTVASQFPTANNIYGEIPENTSLFLDNSEYDQRALKEIESFLMNSPGDDERSPFDSIALSPNYRQNEIIIVESPRANPPTAGLIRQNASWTRKSNSENNDDIFAGIGKDTTFLNSTAFQYSLSGSIEIPAADFHAPSSNCSHKRKLDEMPLTPFFRTLDSGYWSAFPLPENIVGDNGYENRTILSPPNKKRARN